MEESITKQEIITTRKLNEMNSTLQLEVNKLTHAVADLHAQLKDMRAAINTKK
jgi:chaperonin cofactor prefoldin